MLTVNHYPPGCTPADVDALYPEPAPVTPEERMRGLVHAVEGKQAVEPDDLAWAVDVLTELQFAIGRGAAVPVAVRDAWAMVHHDCGGECDAVSGEHVEGDDGR